MSDDKKKPAGAFEGDSDRTTIVNLNDAQKSAALGRMIPVLLISTGPDQGRTISLLAHTIVTCGRAKDCVIALNDPSCSRHHAEFQIVGGKLDQVIVRDKGSTNGTKVNGDRITGEHKLADGDRIQVGDNTVLRISWVPEEAANAQIDVYQRATRDALTGAFNRARFEEALQTEVSFLSRTGQPLGLIYFDVDHFKKINDTFGHLAGDEVLKDIGERVPKIVRSEDIFARIGGEEFAIILRNITEEGIARLAERLREAMAEKPASFEGRGITFTISVGATLCSEKVIFKPDSLLQCSDEALYEAKRTGRNKVIFKPFKIPA